MIDLTNYSPKNHGLSGLVNLGNTCFMNSGLQCIFQTWDLSKYLIAGDFIEHLNQNKNKHVTHNELDEITFVREFVRTLIAYYEDNCIVKPVSIKSVIGRIHQCYVGFRQNDSHEFILRVLDILHQACNNYPYSPLPINDNFIDIIRNMANKTWNEYCNSKNQGYSKIMELFYGQYHATLTCNLCGNISHSFDLFSSWSLAINNNINTLYEAIDNFNREETLDEENKWTCDKCKMKSCATRKISIWKYPQNIIIHIKRFDGFGKKNDMKIDYPIKNLHLTCESDENNHMYDLYAVNIHYGQMMFGHYVALCLNDNGNWYNYDDSDVSQFDKNNVNQHAYLLFYKKTN